MLFPKKISTFAPLKRREIRVGFGRMAEWSNAAVLKTVDLHGSGGSNPSSSAKAGADLAPVLLQKRDSVNLILFCYAKALIPFAWRPSGTAVSLHAFARSDTLYLRKYDHFLSQKKATCKAALFCERINLLGDINLVDFGLLAGGAGEEVLGSDDSGAFITLDLLYPELHC